MYRQKSQLNLYFRQKLENQLIEYLGYQPQYENMRTAHHYMKQDERFTRRSFTVATLIMDPINDGINKQLISYPSKYI